MSTHRIARDSWGYYCLDCSWPGGEFCHIWEVALAHKESGGVK